MGHRLYSQSRGRLHPVGHGHPANHKQIDEERGLLSGSA
jgi:hypothetical protein